jgi:hypothetical protein
MSAPVPYFSKPASAPPARGRILLVSYEFPPADSAGALRWQRLSSFAVERGWGLDVITLDPAYLKSPDLRRLDDLPTGVRIYGVPAKKPWVDRMEQAVFDLLKRRRPRPATPEGEAPRPSASRRPNSLGRSEVQALPWSPRVAVRTWYAFRQWRRQWLWTKRAIALGNALVEPGAHRLFVTCGPPHPVHLAGGPLARRHGLPHVMDMRDPWSLVERMPEAVASPFLFRNAARMEKRAVSGAAMVVCNTRLARDALRRVHPELGARCLTVMNGFDDEALPPARRTRRFLVAYAGTVYLDRDPRGLFRAAAEVIRERALTPDDFGIEFMGTVNKSMGQTLEALAAEEGIDRFVRVRAPRPRKEALEFLAEAAMLVSLPQDSHMAIPSKVFEYMRFDAWLLALADPWSATHEVLRGSGADVVPPDDVSGIARVLRTRMDEYASSGPPSHPALVPECSRAHQARILFDELEALVEDHTRPADPSSATRFA